MGGCLFMLAIGCFIIGFVKLISPAPQGRTGFPMREPAGQVRRTPVQAPAVGAPAPMGTFSGGGTVIGNPQKLDWVEVGSRIYVVHPVKGELMVHVMGRIRYTELWQRTRGAQSTWVPTGNSFYGFMLEGNLFLLNWQARFYLLDESTQLSDAEIQRDFLPYARQFAQSDQTANVVFSYPPAVWKIEDIGKFSIESTDGEVMGFRPGAVGRFIHASGSDERALVLEDYEGGGQDTVWFGYKIEENSIRRE